MIFLHSLLAADLEFLSWKPFSTISKLGPAFSEELPKSLKKSKFIQNKEGIESILYYPLFTDVWLHMAYMYLGGTQVFFAGK